MPIDEVEGAILERAGLTALENDRLEKRRIWKNAFWILAAVHFILWSFHPLATQPNVPLDPVEIVYWGHEWQWGYYKHPPLPSWLAEGMRVLAGPYGVYFLSQISIVAAFWGVWRLGRQIIGDRKALFAVLLLECCPFYNLWTSEFNHGVCMCSTWSLAVLGFYCALQTGHLRYWGATGLALGLGLLTKYNTATLIAPMIGYLLCDREARRHWKTCGPYLTVLIGSALFAPHAVWALSRGSTTVSYIFERTKSDPHWMSRLINPLEFLAGQIAILVPVMLGLLLLIKWPLARRNVSEREEGPRRFLVFMVLGPLVCYLLAAIVLNRSLTAAYGTQLWLFSALLVMVCFQVQEASLAWRRSASWCLGWMVFIAVGAGLSNFANPYLGRRPSRIHFPGRALAEAVESRWHQRYGVPLPIAAGEWWLAGNVNYYGADRSSVYCGGPHAFSLELISAYSDWTDDDDFNRRGGVILWDAVDKGVDFPVELSSRFPVREGIETFAIPYQTNANVGPLRVGIAYIPPGGARSARRASRIDQSTPQ